MCCMVEVDRWVVVGVCGGWSAGGAGVRGVRSLRMRVATKSRSVEPSSTPVPSHRLHGNLKRNTLVKQLKMIFFIFSIFSYKREKNVKYPILKKQQIDYIH